MSRKMVAVMLFVVMSVSGCFPTEKQTPMAQIKIGVTVYRQDDTFISSVVSNVQEAARVCETQNHVKITVNVLDARNSQSIQNDQVDQMISHGFDVICVNEVDRTAAAFIIDKAHAQNIPLVFFNREPVAEDMERWDQVYYVGSDPKEAGEMQAQIVIDAIQKKGIALDKNGDGLLQYVMLEGEPGHQDAAVRTEYCIKTLMRSGIGLEKLANDTANWQRSEATAKMMQWIQTYGDQIEVVFCNNDDMALGVIDAYQAKEITTIPMILGIDATAPAMEAIEKGTLAGTVLNDAQKQGDAIFEIAYALAMHEDPKESVDILNGRYAFVHHAIVTKEDEEIKN